MQPKERFAFPQADTIIGALTRGAMPLVRMFLKYVFNCIQNVLFIEYCYSFQNASFVQYCNYIIKAYFNNICKIEHILNKGILPKSIKSML